MHLCVSNVLDTHIGTMFMYIGKISLVHVACAHTLIYMSREPAKFACRSFPPRVHANWLAAAWKQDSTIYVSSCFLGRCNQRRQQVAFPRLGTALSNGFGKSCPNLIRARVIYSCPTHTCSLTKSISSQSHTHILF